MNVESKETVKIDGETQAVTIAKTTTENIQVDDGCSMASIGTDEGENDDGAVGGIEDDSVFFDDAVPSTSKLGRATAMIVGDQSSPHRSSCDNQEEVDDIELIFSSDDKEFPQEDLVSISYYEPWQMCGQSGTPILVNFNNISSDNEAADDSREKLSPSPIDQDQFYNAIKENVAQQQYSLESCDSLSLGDNLKRSDEFYMKVAGVDKETAYDDDGIKRDESFDTFEAVRNNFIFETFNIFFRQFAKIFFFLAEWNVVDDGPSMDQLQCFPRNGYFKNWYRRRECFR